MTVSKFMFPMNLQFFAEEPEVQEDIKEPVDEPAVEPENELVEQKIEELADQEQPSVPNADYAELQAKFDELAAQVEAMKAVEKAEEVVEPVEPVVEVKTDLEQEKKLAEYESALTSVVNQKLENIPDNIKALMPENLSVSAQLQWIEKAEQAIPKESQAEATPVISSIGQPTPVKTEVEVDLKDLTASQKLQNYFQEFFGK